MTLKSTSDIQALKQSYRGYVREHLARIESKIDFGIPHELIRQELAQEGFEGSLLTFRDALSKARKWRDDKSPRASKASAAKAQVTPTSVTLAQSLEAAPSVSGDLTIPTESYFARQSMLKRKGTSHDKP